MGARTVTLLLTVLMLVSVSVYIEVGRAEYTKAIVIQRPVAL